MARHGIGTEMDSLNLSDPDTDTEDLFESPSLPEKKPAHQRPLNSPGIKGPTSDSNLDSQEVHEASLRRELIGIRSINEAIEGVIESLDRAKGNLDVCFIVLN